MCPSIISHQDVIDGAGDKKMGLRLLGSVIYEDYSTCDLSLNFFTASIGDNPQAKTTRDYPQRPMS